MCCAVCPLTTWCDRPLPPTPANPSRSRHPAIPAITAIATITALTIIDHLRHDRCRDVDSAQAVDAARARGEQGAVTPTLSLSLSLSHFVDQSL